MSLYQRRLEAIMESFDCNAEEAAEIMKIEFAHDDVPEVDEIDSFNSDYDDD